MIEGLLYGFAVVVLMQMAWCRTSLNVIAALGAALPVMLLGDWISYALTPAKVHSHPFMHEFSRSARALEMSYRVYFTWMAVFALIVIGAGYLFKRRRYGPSQRRSRAAIERIRENLSAAERSAHRPR